MAWVLHRNLFQAPPTPSHDPPPAPQARPPREWLRRLEASTGPRLADCSALQLLTLLVSLTQLHALQQQGAPAPLASPLKLPPAAGPAGAAAAAGPTAASAGPSARPGSEWLAAWWAASTRQLQRVRYAPSELALTADWLASLGLRPTAEWMQVGCCFRIQLANSVVIFLRRGIFS